MGPDIFTIFTSGSRPKEVWVASVVIVFSDSMAYLGDSLTAPQVNDLLV